MHRDLQNDSRIEADQILGDLLLRAEQPGVNRDSLIRLRAAYTHLKAYEHQKPANQ